ncbi:MAG TPA: HesA/MoeB/ThiF family protein [Candidatus Acidoferrales bacterium]|nr:HesA/MoeB/ThiF family protein [Candidatus Acidoferrales bacterium]
MDRREAHRQACGRADDCVRHGRVLVVGVGGLGAPAAWHLAAAGVGTVGLIDGDAVELSNLHRQIIYRTADVGRRKVTAAAERIASRYPAVRLPCFDESLSERNLRDVFRGFDFVIDGTDRIETKYLVNDGAALCGLPFSHAGIVGFHGQTMTVVPSHSACLRCLFPSPPPAGDVPTCQETGVIGALAGTIGIVQATEALKFLLGSGTLLADRLLTYDALTMGWRTVGLSRNPACPLCGPQPTIRSLESVTPRACK